MDSSQQRTPTKDNTFLSDSFASNPAPIAHELDTPGRANVPVDPLLKWQNSDDSNELDNLVNMDTLGDWRNAGDSDELGRFHNPDMNSLMNLNFRAPSNLDELGGLPSFIMDPSTHGQESTGFSGVNLSNLSITPQTSSSQELPNRMAASIQQQIHSPYPTNSTISVSSAFHPNGSNSYLNGVSTDVILLSSDLVYFYVHKHRLLTTSNNYFNYHFPIVHRDTHSSSSANAVAVTIAKQSKRPPVAVKPSSKPESDPVISLPESSAVINILLNTIYDKPFKEYAPTFGDLSLSIGALTRYGISLQRYVTPGTPLFNALLDFAEENALALYILAATYNIYPLAVSVSPYLLSFPLSSITDQIAAKLGGFYTKRLFFLHIGRTEALKRLLKEPPRTHPPTFVCDLEEQSKLSRAWTLAGAYIIWDATADISVERMSKDLGSLGDELSCEICKTSLKMRIRNFASEWSQIKMTI